jgi:hypothetical protein
MDCGSETALGWSGDRLPAVELVETEVNRRYFRLSSVKLFSTGMEWS